MPNPTRGAKQVAREIIDHFHKLEKQIYSHPSGRREVVETCIRYTNDEKNL